MTSISFLWPVSWWKIGAGNEKCLLPKEKNTQLFILSTVWHHLCALKKGLSRFTAAFYKVRQIFTEIFETIHVSHIYLKRCYMQTEKKICMEWLWLLYYSWSLLCKCGGWYGCNHVTLIMLFVHKGCRVDVVKEKKRSIIGCIMLSCHCHVNRSQKRVDCVHVILCQSHIVGQCFPNDKLCLIPGNL